MSIKRAIHDRDNGRAEAVSVSSGQMSFLDHLSNDYAKNASDKQERRRILKKSDLIPRSKHRNYSHEFIAERSKWVAEKTGAHLHHAGQYSLNPDELKSRIENMIGVAQIPLGIAGPLKVNGEHADGLFYVPLAATEGTLVETYQRGMLAVTMAGGANVRVLKDALSFSPIFIFKSIADVPKFIVWVKEHFDIIKSAAESTTSHGKLLEIVPYTMGRRVMLDFRYYTGDAMGLNMVSIATAKACVHIMERTDAEHYYIASNLSSDKKASFFNMITGYGKEVSVEATFSREIMLKYLGTTPKALHDIWFIAFLGGQQAGMLGLNCHFANALAAIYIACGQDVAQVVNASIGTILCELTPEGDLSMSLKIPNIVVGTVGGGTMTGSAKECLEMLGCSGSGKAKKFAEIIGATLIAGEISLMAAITSGNFIAAHVNRRKALNPLSYVESAGATID
ncbi:MAG: hydroxymethylglutaryl-CoA reductase [Nitrospirota bacterium]